MRGTIQKIHKGDNYGFLKGDGETCERFFHAGSINDDSPVTFTGFDELDVVRFEPDDSEKRPRVVEKSVFLLAKDNGDVNPIEPEEELI